MLLRGCKLWLLFLYRIAFFFPGLVSFPLIPIFPRNFAFSPSHRVATQNAPPELRRTEPTPALAHLPRSNILSTAVTAISTSTPLPIRLFIPQIIELNYIVSCLTCGDSNFTWPVISSTIVQLGYQVNTDKDDFSLGADLGELWTTPTSSCIV
jgi:hypothetical protein